jgi:hypothetical protein
MEEKSILHHTRGDRNCKACLHITQPPRTCTHPGCDGLIHFHAGSKDETIEWLNTFDITHGCDNPNCGHHNTDIQFHEDTKAV